MPAIVIASEANLVIGISSSAIVRLAYNPVLAKETKPKLVRDVAASAKSDKLFAACKAVSALAPCAAVA